MTDETEQAAAGTAAAETATPVAEQPVNLDAPAAEQAAAPKEGEQPEKPETKTDDDDDEGDPKKLSRHQRQQRRIARLEAELAARTAPAAEPKAKTMEERIGAPPNPREYAGNAAGYNAAVQAYEFDRRQAQREIQREHTESARAQEAQQRVTMAAYAEKQADARDKFKDYDQVVAAARMEVSGPAAAAIMDSDMTGEVEYHLAKNPQKLAELNRMSPQQAARYVGRLEAELSRPVPKTSTQAPSPLTPLKGGAASPSKALKDMSMDEYAAARKAGRRS